MFLRRSMITVTAAALVCAGSGAALAQSGKAAAKPEQRNLTGRYEVRGMNRDGTRYVGQADIAHQGRVVEITWRIENDIYRGRGVVEGRVVTVSWSEPDPVVYTIMPSGALYGVWDQGRALDRLTPR